VRDPGYTLDVKSFRFSGLRIALTVALLLFGLLSASGVVDQQGDAYLQQAFKRALITFAVARGLNGVISVAQGTEVALEPAGVGVTLLPGQILDPVNDLVERFSWVMLASTTALGLQRLFASILGWPVFAWGLAIWMVVVAGLLWWRRRDGWLSIKPGWLLRVTWVLLVLRFAAPVLAMANQAVFTLFLEPDYEQSLAGLQLAREEVSRVEREGKGVEGAAAGRSVFDSVQRLYQSAKDRVNLADRMRRLGDIASRATEHAIDLIVIFIFQTIIFPLLFLWLVVRAVRRLSNGEAIGGRSRR